MTVDILKLTLVTFLIHPTIFYQLCADVPPSQHVEHERFWIRILLPLIGNGSQALVDQELTMKFSIFEKHSAYPLIKECMKVRLLVMIMYALDSVCIHRFTAIGFTLPALHTHLNPACYYYHHESTTAICSTLSSSSLTPHLPYYSLFS